MMGNGLFHVTCCECGIRWPLGEPVRDRDGWVCPACISASAGEIRPSEWHWQRALDAAMLDRWREAIGDTPTYVVKDGGR